jgi:hypothetical protein
MSRTLRTCGDQVSPIWNRTEAFYGHPFVFSTIFNFGGRSGLYGRLQLLQDGLQAAWVRLREALLCVRACVLLCLLRQLRYVCPGEAFHSSCAPTWGALPRALPLGSGASPLRSSSTTTAAAAATITTTTTTTTPRGDPLECHHARPHIASTTDARSPPTPRQLPARVSCSASAPLRKPSRRIPSCTTCCST